jgi:cell division septal protein FtsQ
MNQRSAWLYLVLGAVALYVLWGLYVHATVTVPADEIKVRYTPGVAATDEERIDWTLVDSLPVPS